MHVHHVPEPSLPVDCSLLLCLAGENSIIIVGGANQAAWELTEATQQVRIGSTQCSSALLFIPFDPIGLARGMSTAAGLPGGIWAALLSTAVDRPQQGTMHVWI